MRASAEWHAVCKAAVPQTLYARDGDACLAARPGSSLKSRYEAGISHSRSAAVTGVKDVMHTPHGPSAEVQAKSASSMNSAIDAVNPCNALRPAIGPISPAAKKPASGIHQGVPRWSTRHGRRPRTSAAHVRCR